MFSGIEAASVASIPLQWRFLAFSEIEDFPSAVLKYRFPEVPNLGDMTQVDWGKYRGLVDVVVGGSPCQAFSVAGLRRSLADDRGNLTLQFVKAVDAIDPLVTVWENVPGVLNTKDNAFGCLLAGLAGEDKPLVPPGKKWTNAGYVLGPKRTIAWRVLDAQYFGVAQRRRRVFVVASPRNGVDPRAVLFEREGLRRDTAPSREAREDFTHDIAPSLVSSGRGVERAGDSRGQDPVVAVVGGSSRSDNEAGKADPGGLIPVTHPSSWWDGGQVSQTLDAVLYKGQTMPEKNRFPAVVQTRAFANQGHFGSYKETEVCDPLRSKGGDVGPGGESLVMSVTGEISHALNTANNGKMSSEDGTGRGVPIIAFSAKDYSADAQEDLSPTLRAGGHSESHANAGVPPAVAFDLRGREGGAQCEGPHDTANIRASSGGSSRSYVVELASRLREEGLTLKEAQDLGRPYAVRRLTPVECERLQGFPDNWTYVTYRNKPAANGPRYKALGNSMAVPVMYWIFARAQRLVEALFEELIAA